MAHRRSQSWGSRLVAAVHASADLVMRRHSPLGEAEEVDGGARTSREKYAGLLPPDLVLLVVVLTSGGLLVLPNLFTPLVLLGLIDARTPSSLVVGLIGLVVCAMVALAVCLA